MKLLHPYLLFFLLAPLVSAAQDVRPLSARSQSLHNAVVATPRSGVLSDNPASIAFDTSRSFIAEVSFAPERYALPDANHFSAGIGYREQASRITIAATVTSVSFEDIFSDQAVSLSASKLFSLGYNRSASVGARLRYEEVAFTTDYPSVGFFIIDAGLQFSLSDEFFIGVDALNLLGSSFTASNGERNELPRTFDLGFCYAPQEVSIRLMTQLRKETDTRLFAVIGAEYIAAEYIVLRGGTSTMFESYSGGVGLHYASLAIDAAMQYHSVLGTTFVFSISNTW